MGEETEHGNKMEGEQNMMENEGGNKTWEQSGITQQNMGTE